METKYFSESETIGFEVKSAKDIFAAKELGMIICNEDDYDFDDMVTYTNEDGEEWEREPTEDEITNRAIEHLNNGGKVYATIYPSNYKLVDKRATTLQTDFFIDQKVFFLLENKITEGTIKNIYLTDGTDEPSHTRDVCERIYDRIRGYVAPNSNAVPWHMLDNDAQHVITTCVKGLVASNSAVISYVTKMYKTNLVISLPLNEVFATKEELVKHLMED